MISIIIPVYNEEGNIGPTIQRLMQEQELPLITEIIVADGGSSDNTVAEATTAGARVITSAKKGRAAQMNAGAALAKSSILYFLHADSQPPVGFTKDIVQAVQQGFACGCYRLQFDHRHWFLSANAWFTRFNINAVRFGDQSLFVTREVFQKAGGFKESLIVMEDQEIIGRIRKHGKFKVLHGSVTTSARKYLENGFYKMQGVFFVIYFMYQLGYSQNQLVSTYRKWIRQDKV